GNLVHPTVAFDPGHRLGLGSQLGCHARSVGCRCLGSACKKAQQGARANDHGCHASCCAGAAPAIVVAHLGRWANKLMLGPLRTISCLVVALAVQGCATTAPPNREPGYRTFFDRFWAYYPMRNAIEIAAYNYKKESGRWPSSMKELKAAGFCP